MKTKKRNFSVFFEGVESSFDLLGSGFSRVEKQDAISDVWYRVGGYFSHGLNEIKSSEVRNKRKDSKILEHCK